MSYIIKPHRSTSWMRPIATNRTYRGLFVCPNRDTCRMAEPVMMPLGMWTRVGPRDHVLDEADNVAVGKAAGIVMKSPVPSGSPFRELWRTQFHP